MRAISRLGGTTVTSIDRACAIVARRFSFEESCTEVEQNSSITWNSGRAKLFLKRPLERVTSIKAAVFSPC